MTTRLAEHCACIPGSPCEAHLRQYQRQHLAHADEAPESDDFMTASDAQLAWEFGTEHDGTYADLRRAVAERFSDRGPKAIAEMQAKAAAGKRYVFEMFN